MNFGVLERPGPSDCCVVDRSEKLRRCTRACRDGPLICVVTGTNPGCLGLFFKPRQPEEDLSSTTWQLIDLFQSASMPMPTVEPTAGCFETVLVLRKSISPKHVPYLVVIGGVDSRCVGQSCMVSFTFERAFHTKQIQAVHLLNSAV